MSKLLSLLVAAVFALTTLGAAAQGPAPSDAPKAEKKASKSKKTTKKAKKSKKAAPKTDAAAPATK